MSAGLTLGWRQVHQLLQESTFSLRDGCVAGRGMAAHGFSQRLVNLKKAPTTLLDRVKSIVFNNYMCVCHYYNLVSVLICYRRTANQILNLLQDLSCVNEELNVG